MKKTLTLVMAAFVISLMASCGGGAKTELNLSDEAKMLMNKTWYPDTKADTQLGGDIEKIGNFFAGKYLFGTAEDDPSNLVYSCTSGEGFFSSTTAGRWKLLEDNKTLLMYSYDYDAGAYKTDADTCTILELTPETLVWQKKGVLLSEHFSTTKP
ncbi:MAG: hypothetical protein J6Z01_10755 [Bacteroidales bacterium]|nr:hypothetical protein [Bacteroidales bacterium]